MTSARGPGPARTPGRTAVHEAAITSSMLQAALAAAADRQASRITRITLAVGREAGVVPDCVRHYFDLIKPGTPAESATLEFRTVPLVLRCPRCQREFSELADICACNAGAEIISGRELVIESIEIE